MKPLFYILCFLPFLIACQKSSKPKANPNIPPKYVESEPVFKKQGELSFIYKTDTLSTINIEIADTPKKTAKGLMHRKHMEENNGMLFIFDTERRQSFWMKNTHISLDIIFVNANKEIVFIAPETTPYSTKQIPSFEYAQYVVEVNAGYCKKFGIKVGDVINFVRF